MQETIVCKLCGKKTEGENGEGPGQSAISTEKAVNAGYGSVYDCDVYAWIGEPAVVGDVCDDCINKLIADGKLKFEFNTLERADVENDDPCDGDSDDDLIAMFQQPDPQ